MKHAGEFNRSGFAIEAKRKQLVSIKRIYKLKDLSTGNYLLYMLPLNPTLR